MVQNAPARPPAGPPARGGFMGFLTKSGPLGLDWWMWGAIGVGTILAVWLVPKFFGNRQATDAASTNAGSAQANSAGLIDPQTGVPYATEYAAQYQPAGAGIGQSQQSELDAIYSLLLNQQATQTQNGNSPGMPGVCLAPAVQLAGHAWNQSTCSWVPIGGQTVLPSTAGTRPPAPQNRPVLSQRTAPSSPIRNVS